MLRAGLALYDALSFGDGLPASGRLDDDDIAQLPRLRQEGLTSVLHYCDCLTDDARLTLSVLLDARARGADILNRRAVTAITPLANGYAVALDERGQARSVEARFIVNAAGPWVARIDGLTSAAPSPPVKVELCIAPALLPSTIALLPVALSTIISFSAAARSAVSSREQPASASAPTVAKRAR